LLIHRRRRRIAERRLAESEERLLSTAAAANVGLWQLDPKTNELWVTEHCRKLFGLSDGAPLTRASLMTTIHPEDRDIAVSSLQAVDGADRRSLGDVRILAPDGTNRWIRIRTRVDPDKRSAPQQLRGIFADITDLKAAETEAVFRRDEVAHLKRIREREGRLMTMNAMSASIVHEISQPIGAMMASADAALVWLGKTPPELDSVRTSVERIADGGRRASDVVASVRNLFRRDGGVTELVDVNDLVAEILAIEHDELQRHAIGIKAALTRSAMVSFDRVQLQQAVLNLVTNAMEAMVPVTDRPRVLRVQTRLDGSDDVLIAVEDSGVGIDRAGLDRIFEPFFTTKSRGMGLGLWLCRRIVENHHGRLTASSEVGRGSCFEIVLPSANVRMASAANARRGGEDG
jgi:PAS domain S-box-containing protein